MKRMKIFGLCAVAIAIGCAASATAAVAVLPEFKAAKFPVEFTAQGEKTIFHSQNLNVECKSTFDTGKVNAAELVTEDNLYSKCTVEGTVHECSSPGVFNKGTLETKELAGGPIYLEGGGAGITLRANFGKTITEFTCEESPLGKVTVEGCMIGEVTPLNTLFTTGELLFLENATHDGPKWTEEGKCLMRAVEGTETHSMWVTVVETTKFASQIELKA